MTSQIRLQIEYLIQTQYSCAHFILRINEKSSQTGGLYVLRVKDDLAYVLGNPVCMVSVACAERMTDDDDDYFLSRTVVKQRVKWYADSELTTRSKQCNRIVASHPVDKINDFTHWP